MPINWSILSAEILCKEAAQYRHDHDNGSACFFDADRAHWHLQHIDPASLGAFSSAATADHWLQSEIALLRAEGDGRAVVYEDMLLNGFTDPIVVGMALQDSAIWDGYHRTAISMIRGEQLLAIVGVLRQ